MVIEEQICIERSAGSETLFHYHVDSDHIFLLRFTFATLIQSVEVNEFMMIATTFPQVIIEPVYFVFNLILGYLSGQHLLLQVLLVSIRSRIKQLWETLAIGGVLEILWQMRGHSKRDPIVVILLFYIHILVHTHIYMIFHLLLIIKIQKERLRNSLDMVYRILALVTDLLVV